MSRTADMPPKVCLTGGFDLSNFGDILFPLLAIHELHRRLPEVEVVIYSYRAVAPPSWPYRVSSLVDLSAGIGNADLLIVGGGDLVRFDTHIAPGYRPPTPTIHHPTGYWLMPTLLAACREVPAVWNAVGVNPALPRWGHDLVAAAARSLTYLSVRDSRSAETLHRIAADLVPRIVPDTAFGIASLLDMEAYAEADALLRQWGAKRPFIVIQPSPALNRYQGLLRGITSRVRQQGLTVIELPIGPVLGDRPGIGELGDTIRPRSWPTPLALAAIIGKAEAVIGKSLHLSIVAIAQGVPVHRFRSSDDPKHQILTDFTRVIHWDDDEDENAELCLGREEIEPLVNENIAQLDAHWDRVVDAVGSSYSRSGDLVSWLIRELTMAREQCHDSPL